MGDPADQPPQKEVKLSGWWWWAIGIVVLIVIVSQLNSNDDKSNDDTSAAPTTTPVGGLYPGGPTRPGSPPRSAPVDDTDYIPGNGYHNIGGLDGKYWGIWQSTGSPNECTWSIRLTSPNYGATILDQGGSAANTPVRVNIQPPGDVSSLTGEIDGGGRIVLQTSGCGAWKRTA